jgi:pre-mRNA-splicing factor RBM22/SLT11
MSVSRLAEGEKATAAPGIELGEDFPVICDACLGPNPYTRMIKQPMAKECRISGQPFTGFRWQGALKRWKETLVCSTVARDKNCCQACLNDLEYAVPFHVRDQVMEALGDETPSSDVSKEFYWANKRQRALDVANGAGSSLTGPGGFDTYEKLQGSVDKLRELAALSTAPVSWSERRAPMTADEQERLRQRRLAEKRPPADQSVTSLYVGGVPPSATKQDLLPYFLAYGAVKELTVDAQRLAAIVTYRERGHAETACAALYNNFTYKGSRLRVSWARRKGDGGRGAGGAASSTDVVSAAGHDHYGRKASSSAVVPPPPSAAVAGGATSKPPPPPPGVRLPPGIRKRPAADVYPSQTPEGIAQRGVRPEQN